MARRFNKEKQIMYLLSAAPLAIEPALCGSALRRAQISSNNSINIYPKHGSGAHLRVLKNRVSKNKAKLALVPKRARQEKVVSINSRLAKMCRELSKLNRHAPSQARGREDWFRAGSVQRGFSLKTSARTQRSSVSCPQHGVPNQHKFALQFSQGLKAKAKVAGRIVNYGTSANSSTTSTAFLVRVED